jgi:hypothetical protein
MELQKKKLINSRKDSFSYQKKNKRLWPPWQSKHTCSFSLPDGDLRSQRVGLSHRAPPPTNEVCLRIWGDRWPCRLEPFTNLPGSWRDCTGPVPPLVTAHSSALLVLSSLPSNCFCSFVMLYATVNILPYVLPSPSPCAFLVSQHSLFSSSSSFVYKCSILLFSDPIKFLSIQECSRREPHMN